MKCTVDKKEAGSVNFMSIISMKNVDAQPWWWPVLTVCMLSVHKCCQELRSHVATHADSSKALSGSLSLINFSLKGVQLDGKFSCSISVGLIRSSVNTSFKNGIAKDEEKAGVTEHIISTQRICYGHLKSWDCDWHYQLHGTWKILVQLTRFRKTRHLSSLEQSCTTFILENFFVWNTKPMLV